MAKYVYPAVIRPDSDGFLTVRFPDLPGCLTQGTDLPDALEQAEDALCLLLYSMEEDGMSIPAPSALANFHNEGDTVATLVSCDTIEYRKLYDARAVKKTLSIPAWLNTMAERENINFSGALQDALRERLHIADR